MSLQFPDGTDVLVCFYDGCSFFAKYDGNLYFVDEFGELIREDNDEQVMDAKDGGENNE